MERERKAARTWGNGGGGGNSRAINVMGKGGNKKGEKICKKRKREKVD